jgi:hypothetical protein
MGLRCAKNSRALPVTIRLESALARPGGRNNSISIFAAWGRTSPLAKREVAIWGESQSFPRLCYLLREGMSSRLARVVQFHIELGLQDSKLDYL